MRQAGRILNEAEIGRWPGRRCHIRPAYCSPEELEQEVQNLHRRFYSLPSILSRLPPPFTTANIDSWMLNISHHRTARNLRENMNFGTY